jgi:hypothetical protein
MRPRACIGRGPPAARSPPTICLSKAAPLEVRAARRASRSQLNGGPTSTDQNPRGPILDDRGFQCTDACVGTSEQRRPTTRGSAIVRKRADPVPRPSRRSQGSRSTDWPAARRCSRTLTRRGRTQPTRTRRRTWVPSSGSRRIRRPRPSAAQSHRVRDRSELTRLAPTSASACSAWSARGLTFSYWIRWFHRADSALPGSFQRAFMRMTRVP